MPALPECNGPSLRWLISLATPAGAALWKARARTLTWAPPWRQRKYAVFRAHRSVRTSVLACVKHFAGYGAAEGGRDYDSSYIPEVLLRNVYLVPFHAAEKAGAATFMSAYMDLNDVPATGNRWLLHDVLRQEWGFKGFVVSDALAVGKLETHGYARDPEDAALKAFTAGLNMDMASLTYIHNLPETGCLRQSYRGATGRGSHADS